MKKKKGKLIAIEHNTCPNWGWIDCSRDREQGHCPGGARTQTLTVWSQAFCSSSSHPKVAKCRDHQSSSQPYDMTRVSIQLATFHKPGGPAETSIPHPPPPMPIRKYILPQRTLVTSFIFSRTFESTLHQSFSCAQSLPSESFHKDGNVKINFLEKKQKWIFFPLNGLDSKIYERNTSWGTGWKAHWKSHFHLDQGKP